MKTRKTIHEMSNTINANQLDVTNLQFFKIFCLPIWVAVVMSISLGFVTKPVRAENTGTEDIQHYRHIEPQGVENTAGRASQNTKESPAAKDTGAKKTNQGEQSTNSGTGGTAGNANQATKESSTEKCVGAEKTTSGSQNTNTGQNTQQSPLAKDPKAEGSMSGDQKSPTDREINPAKKPEKDTGEFPSGEFPSFSQVDINGDHNITKDELQNFPDLLQVFDKVDAGKDGKLEQHEYQNLEMETKREGEVL